MAGPPFFSKTLKTWYLSKIEEIRPFFWLPCPRVRKKVCFDRFFHWHYRTFRLDCFYHLGESGRKITFHSAEVFCPPRGSGKYDTSHCFCARSGRIMSVILDFVRKKRAFIGASWKEALWDLRIAYSFFKPKVRMPFVRRRHHTGWWWLRQLRFWKRRL